MYISQGADISQDANVSQGADVSKGETDEIQRKQDQLSRFQYNRAEPSSGPLVLYSLSRHGKRGFCKRSRKALQLTKGRLPER